MWLIYNVIGTLEVRNCKRAIAYGTHNGVQVYQSPLSLDILPLMYRSISLSSVFNKNEERLVGVGISMRALAGLRDERQPYLPPTLGYVA